MLRIRQGAPFVGIPATTAILLTPLPRPPSHLGNRAILNPTQHHPKPPRKPSVSVARARLELLHPGRLHPLLSRYSAGLDNRQHQLYLLQRHQGRVSSVQSQLGQVSSVEAGPLRQQLHLLPLEVACSARSRLRAVLHRLEISLAPSPPRPQVPVRGRLHPPGVFSATSHQHPARRRQCQLFITVTNSHSGRNRQNPSSQTRATPRNQCPPSLERLP